MSLRSLMAVSPGFRSDQLTTGQVSLPALRYGSEAARLTFIDRLTAALSRQPGVASTGIATNVPFSGSTIKSAVSIQGRPVPSGRSPRAVYAYGIGGNYLAAMGIPLLEGRLLTEGDARPGARVCVVDEDFARRYWPQGGAVSQKIFPDPVEGAAADAFTIVGVVASVKQASLSDDERIGAVYYPYSGRFDSALYVVTRARGAVGAGRGDAAAGRAGISIPNCQSTTSGRWRRASTTVWRRSRSPAVFAALFAAIALALTTLGTYGVVSYAVERRRREIGLRMALGARPEQVRAQFVVLSMRLLATGLALGAVGSWFGDAAVARADRTDARHAWRDRRGSLGRAGRHLPRGVPGAGPARRPNLANRRAPRRRLKPRSVSTIPARELIGGDRRGDAGAYTDPVTQPIFPVRLAVGTALALAGGVLATAAQPPQLPRPTFSSKVDLVSVDVNVIDADGRPVRNLGAADFTLRVDGQLRKIVSALFVSMARSAAEAPAETPRAEYSTNVTPTPGRLIAIVVDRGSISPVRSKDVFGAAARFVDALPASDRVGLFSIPQGTNLDFTTKHDGISTALLHMDGAKHASPAVKYVSTAEALEIERGNTIAIQEVTRRECGAQIDNLRGATGGGDIAICQRLVQDEAATVAQLAHERARDSVNGLTGILQRLGSSDTPKTIVLISEGMVIDGERFVTNGLARLLAATHTTIYTLKPEPSDSDASRPRAPQNAAQERAVQETGLSMVTRLGGGELFRIIGSPTMSFDRLASELSGYYLLGFEPDPGIATASSTRSRSRSGVRTCRSARAPSSRSTRR